MAILKENQDILSSQIQKTFKFVNLTCTETDTNRLILRSVQKDILQIKCYYTLPIKRTKSTFPWQKFLYYHVSVEKPFSYPFNGINSVKIDILTILNQISVIS